MPTYSMMLGIDRIVNFVSFNLKIKVYARVCIHQDIKHTGSLKDTKDS